MRTAFTSWKLAKGLYIIPVVMAYHPLLLDGPTGEVVRTVIGTTLALLAFVVAMERYFLAPISWLETVLYAASAVAMIWVGHGVNYAGMGLFALLVAYHLRTVRVMRTA